MGNTIHYIDETWKLNSKLIEMENLKEKHLASYLLNVLNNYLSEFDIKDKILK